MYLSHFGLSEAPFRITPHTDFFFEGANRGATLEALLYTITNDEGIVKVTGEVGSGKTMLCRVLIERLPAHVQTVYLSSPSLGRDEILRSILDDLKVSAPGERPVTILRALQEHLISLYGEGRRVVVLIDEAHAMAPETLEEIRLLSNLETKREKLMQIVLFGQQELDDLLGMPQMRPLRERIVHSFRLEPLVRSDIGTYLMFRMRQAGYRGPNLFAPAAVRLIAEASQGLTRRINILADKALLSAFSDGEHEVNTRHVKAAVADSEFTRLVKPAARRMPHWAMWAGALGLLVAGAALTIIATRWQEAPGAPAPAVSSNRPPEPPATPIAAAPPTQTHATQQSAAAATPADSAASAPTRAQGALPSTAAPAPASAPAVARSPALAPSSAPTDAPTPAAAATSTAAPVPASAALPEKSAAGLPAAAVSRTPILDARFTATVAWLKEAPADAYALQLMAIDPGRTRELDDWLRRVPAGLPRERVFVFGARSQSDEERLHVVLGTFTSREEALAAAKSLPPQLAGNKPQLRSLANIRSQAQPR
ncbi:MAG: AAA family ATPase [Burkholderiales bacterium]|nr:AAA family ATPase [Burkholderiales bacterium]